jgi:hypothetical protein
MAMLLSVPALAQTTVATYDKATIGGDTLPADVLRILGIGSVGSGSGTINPIAIDNLGDVRKDTTTTVSTAGAHTWSAAGSFTSTLGVTGVLSGNTGTLLLEDAIRASGATSEFQFNETDQGTGLKNWRFLLSGSQFALQALDDSYASLGDLIRGYRRSSADLYGGVGSPDTFEWGQYVRNAWPARNNTLLLGGPVRKIGAVYTNELLAEVFTVIEKQVIGNGAFRVGRGTTLTRDVTSGATTIFVKDRVFRYHDFGILQGLGSSGQPQFEVIRIVQAGGYDCTGATSPLPSACGGVDNDDYAISVERNKDLGSTNAWVSGDGVSATDRYLDLYAWQSGVITGGGAIMGDRPHAYWNFNDSLTTQVNRAAESGGTITALNSTGATTSGGFAGDGGSWHRNSLSDAQAFAANIATINTGTAGGTEIACSMTIEMVYFVNGTTPGSANSQRPVAKWDGSSTSTVTFLVEHWGSAAGGSFNGKLALLGTPVANPITILTPLITPAAGWHHIVFTYSNVNGGRAYLNGVLTGTPTAPVASNACMVTNANDVTGYLWGNNGNPNAGHISELAIYATELSEEQIDAHYDAFQTNRTGFAAGPTIVGYERTSDVNWYGVSERWACGQLAGLYGFTQLTYGCGWGDTTATYVTATASDGFSIYNAGSRKFWADTSGNLSLTGDLSIGTSGSLRSGATAYDTGTGYWLDYNGGTPRFRIGTTSAGASYLRWTGSALELKSNTTTINASGITVEGGTGASAEADRAYKFEHGDAFDSGLYSYGTSVRQLNLHAVSNGPTRLDLGAENASGNDAFLTLLSQNGGTGSRFLIQAGEVNINGNVGFTGSCAASATLTVTNGIITGGC